LRPLEACELVGVGLANAAWVATRTALEAWRFGRRAWWWRLRLALGRAWLGHGPLGVIAREGRQAGMEEADLVYGETLPGTACDLLRALEVGPQDTVVDLGCGRGVVPLVAGLVLGARAVGLDALPGYVQRASACARSLGLEQVRFLHADFRTAELPRGTVYFLAGTTLEPDSWTAVARNLARSARPGSRAASLSQPLPGAEWEALGSRRMAFSWGWGTVFLHRRRGPARGQAAPATGSRRRCRKGRGAPESFNRQMCPGPRAIPRSPSGLAGAAGSRP